VVETLERGPNLIFLRVSSRHYGPCVSLASRVRLRDRLRGASDASREPCSLFGKWSVRSLRTSDGRGAWRQPPLVWPARASVGVLFVLKHRPSGHVGSARRQAAVAFGFLGKTGCASLCPVPTCLLMEVV